MTDVTVAGGAIRGADADGSRVSVRSRVAVLTVLAAVLRFAWLGTPPATFDETWSWYDVHLIRTWPHGLPPVGFDMDGPWYALINLAVTSVLGNEIGPLR